MVACPRMVAAQVVRSSCILDVFCKQNQQDLLMEKMQE